jgi:hypothetical protein
LLFRHKNEPPKLHVDLGDLENEKENMINYLQTHLKVTVSQSRRNLLVESENVTLPDLHHVAKKFVYSRGHGATHYVSIEGSTVRINRFKGGHGKKDKHSKESPSQSLTQTWGL